MLKRKGFKDKWSYKYDKCVKCGKTKFNHKGRGLCTSCWDKERDRNNKRKKQKQEAGKRYYLKVKDTIDFQQERLKAIKKYQGTQKYKLQLQYRYAKNRVDRYVKTGWKTHKKKLDGNIIINVNGKKVITTVKAKNNPEDLTGVEQFEINYLRSLLTKKTK